MMQRSKLLWVSIAMALIVGAVTAPNAFCQQNIQAPGVTIPIFLIDYKCTKVGAGSPILRMFCTSTPQGCTGECYRGIVLEDYYDCYPQQDSICSYTLQPVKVKVTEVAVCVRDPRGTGCDCGDYRRVAPYEAEFFVRECGG